MLLKKIKLKNIRSFSNLELDLPTGSTLLSGNIGSGKSTILLAIDFALFGLRRGELSGSALLKTGTSQASVELSFKLNEKEFTIKRSLMNNKGSIVQDTGHIIENNIKKELTTVELKKLILDLLNYPKELLTKHKGLVYRYTVYTPQEEMKSILFGDTETRLDTLRKVFGIDKYKRIVENINIYTTHLRTQKREITGYISDLEEKENLLKEKQEFNKNILEDLKKIEINLKNKQQELKDNKEKLTQIEQKTKELQEFKNNLNIKNTDLKNKVESFSYKNKEIINLEKEIETLNQETKEKTITEIKDKNTIKEDITKIEQNLNKNISSLTELTTKKSSSEEIINSLEKLDFCPLCKQDVNQEHKQQVKNKENTKIQEFEENILKLTKEKENLNINLNNIKENLENLTQKEKENEILTLKLKNLQDKNKLLTNITKEKINLKQQIGSLNLEITDLDNKIDNLKHIEQEFTKIKETYEIILSQERELSIKHSSINTKTKDIETEISELQQEIQKKLIKKQKIQEINNLQSFLSIEFTNLLETLERKVLTKIYFEFNELFKNWFNILVGETSLKVRLDGDFSVKVEQNGYELEYINLSGGEKTAAALAYRLALNHVINNLMSKINTKDILILDEPTDGFSSDQLDNMRLVLDELNVKQLIIVSHESKIETFVDNVIRFRKEDGVSFIEK